MLACNHDVCLQCAAKYFQKITNSQHNNTYVCGICGIQTHLDHSSVYELEKIVLLSQRTFRSNSHFGGIASATEKNLNSNKENFAN